MITSIRNIDTAKTIDAKASQNVRQALIEKLGGSFPAGPDRVYWVAVCNAVANCPPGEPLTLSDALQDFLNRTYGAIVDGTADAAAVAVTTPA